MTATAIQHSGTFRVGNRTNHGGFDRRVVGKRDFPVENPAPTWETVLRWQGYHGSTVELKTESFDFRDCGDDLDYVRLTLTVDGQVLPVCYTERYYMTADVHPRHTVLVSHSGRLVLEHLPIVYVASGPNAGPSQPVSATWKGDPLVTVG